MNAAGANGNRTRTICSKKELRQYQRPATLNTDVAKRRLLRRNELSALLLRLRIVRTRMWNFSDPRKIRLLTPVWIAGGGV
jgi:hypothetical protein